MFPKSLQTMKMAIIAAGASVGAMLLMPTDAHAIPSFARQTGLACEACHTQFLELTPFGRLFKMRGYVQLSTKEVSATNEKKKQILSLSDLPPVSAMIQVSSTSTAKAQPDGTGAKQATNFALPQQLSLFYGGRVTPKLGAFFQLTYAGDSGSFGIDNSDIRFADDKEIGGQDVIYGITINNNPSVQDVWNSTPAWSFPSAEAVGAPASAASTLFGQDWIATNVAGIGAYAFINQLVYLEFTGYRTAHQGTDIPDSSTDHVIDTFAPYWRAALSKDWNRNSLEVGTFGMAARILNPNAAVPLSGAGQPSDKYLDIGLDAQYQYIGDDNIFTLAGRWIHERQKLNASFSQGLTAKTNEHVDQAQLVGSYYYKRKYGISLGLFQTTGSSDSTLYAASPYEGSRTNSPDTRYGMVEIDYMPWLNTKLFAQYTAFDKFNGSSSNYDGSGRSASDNNTLFVGLWSAF